MLLNLFENIKKQWVFLSLYSIFLIVIGVLLYQYDKGDTTRLVNSTWTDFQDVFFSYFTHIGDFVTAIIVIVALLFYKFKYAIIGTSSFVLTALVTQFLKKIIYPDVFRPKIELWHEFKNGDLHIANGVELLISNSFPSGHTTSAFSIFFFLSMVINKKWVSVILLMLAVLAGYSRAYLSHHFLEDVFAGSIIGTLGSLLIFSMFQNINFGNWGDKSLLRLK